MKWIKWIYHFNAMAGLFGICLNLTPPAHAFYHPSQGRWFNRDPMADDQLGVYSRMESTRSRMLTEVKQRIFVGNNPLTATDPFGLEEADNTALLAFVWGCCGGMCSRSSNDQLRQAQRTAQRAGQAAGDSANPDRNSGVNEAVRHCVATGVLATFVWLRVRFMWSKCARAISGSAWPGAKTWPASETQLRGWPARRGLCVTL